MLDRARGRRRAGGAGGHLTPAASPLASFRATTARTRTRPLEWWYWTGHLSGADGRPYGFQLTFFRLRDVHLAHFAWSDVGAQRFVPSKRRRTSRCPGSRAPRKSASTSSTRTGPREKPAARRRSRVPAMPGSSSRSRSRPAKPPVASRRGRHLAQGTRTGNEYSHYVSITAPRGRPARSTGTGRPGSAHGHGLVRPRVGARVRFPRESPAGTGSRCSSRTVRS